MIAIIWLRIRTGYETSIANPEFTMTKTRSTLAALCLVALTVTAQAQQHHHQATKSSPYAGFETRAVKALSDEQITELKTGKGMGLALAAELNGYPGPSHVVEMQQHLGLTEEQRARMRALFEAMKAEVVPIGERLIAQETELDRQFAEKTITLASLTDMTREIGLTQAALRAAHLKYHLSTVEVLSPDQVRRYNELRGYGSRPATIR